MTETHSMFGDAHVERESETQAQIANGAAAMRPPASTDAHSAAAAAAPPPAAQGGGDGAAAPSAADGAGAAAPAASVVPAGVRVEDMPKPAEQSEESDGPGSGASQHKSDNATVLRSLFNGGDGVKGAISHDRIMEGKAVDRVIVRQRAEQIATAAKEGLRRSGQMR